MTDSELPNFKKLLESKRTELEAKLRNREEIEIVREADVIDDLQVAHERELAVASLDRDTALLADVRAALERIEDGSYGLCLHCDEEINPRRLAAVPWTPHCLHCQEAIECEAGDRKPEFPWREAA